MSAGRFIGGIIAFLGGVFVLITCIMGMNIILATGTGEVFFQWILNLVIGILAIFGGFMGLASKNGGGSAIIAGILSLVLGILSVTILGFMIIGVQYSLFQTTLGIGPWYGITLEAILMIIGAVIMLASSNKE